MVLRSDLARAIPLITYSRNTGIFDVNPDAVSFLSQLPAPIGVVSVAGRYRTGKSYLLNRVFLNRKSGFSVGPTVNPCTKGLWVWASPVEGRTKDGRPCTIIVIDSEGIGALDTDTDHDTRIFSLAILLSSCFVYNSVGAIDENAISNLSLVVNITKHVHIKSTQEGVKNYSEYFPEFMWVVRDFTLRLVDNEGNKISPQEYLERSLQPQKNNENDEKNKIRRHLTEFFKARDCTTLVRPIEREEDLQNLDNLEISCLREEFAEQVYVLREKVLLRIKPKSLNGKELNGEMFANLMGSYVNAMNSGVVPNIESSWSLVCKLQNKKIQEEAKAIYENTFAGLKKFPMSEEILKNIHNKAKNACFQYFSESVVIEDEKLLTELSSFVTQMFRVFKQENNEMAKKESGNFLKEAFGKVEEKIKQGEIASLQEFEKHMKIIEKEFEVKGPGLLKKECFLEFYREKVYRVSDLFLHSATNELALHKDLASEHISRVEKELKTASDALMQEKTTHQKLNSVFLTEKTEQQVKEKAFKDQISSLMMDREKLENSLRESADALKHKNQIELEKANLKNSELSENIKEIERELARKKSEIEEDRALSSQKLKLMENALEEVKSKEKSTAAKLKELKNDNVSGSKTLQNKYETLISKMQEKLDSKSNDFKDLQLELEGKENVIEELKQMLSDTQIAFAAEKSENDSQIDLLQRKLKQKEDEVILKISTLSQESQNELILLRYKLEESDRRLKHSEEELRCTSENSQQELAILSQKNEFFEQEIEELRTRRQEEKRQFDARLFNFENFQTVKNEPNLEKIKAEQSEEISRLLKDHETEKVILTGKIDDLLDLKNDLELKLKLERNEWTHKEKLLKEQVNEALASKSRLLLEAAAKSSFIDDSKSRMRILELEKDLENVRKMHLDEIEAQASKTEITISQLRSFFDQEKFRLEQKISDEKNKAEKRLSETIEEFEEKISNEMSQHNEELAALQEEYTSMETYYNTDIKELSDKIEIDFERISHLETYIESLKEQLNQAHLVHSEESQSQIELFSGEKLELLKKIEVLTDENSAKEKKNITMKYEIEKIEGISANRLKELEDLQGKYVKERNEYTEKASILTEKYETLYNEHVKATNKAKRDLALANNEADLLNKRCKDLEETIQELEKKGKPEGIKEDSNIFASFNLKSLQKEKETAEKKLDEKKKALKALESSSSKNTAAFERERAVLEEKLSYSDRKRTEIEQYYQETVAALQLQLNNRPSLPYQNTNSEAESLKLQVSKLERDIAAKQLGYDRDKSLWENKFNFLMQQRDYSRKELVTAQEKFDQIIEELKKKNSAEREKQENNSKTLISSLETRYNSQMNDLQARYEQTIKEIRDKNRHLERTLQNLTEELDNERRERSNSASAFEKKLQQGIDLEKKYQKDLQEEKAARSASLAQMVENFSKERDEWRQKMTENEKKIKEIDQQKSQIFVQSEKDRVKWTLEKEELLTKYAESQYELNGMLKKQEDLRKENEKLKTPRPKVGRKGDSGLSFDDFKYSRAQSGRSTPTNCTNESPRVKAFAMPAVQRTLSKEAFKDDS